MNSQSIPRNVFHPESLLLAHVAGRLLRLGIDRDPRLDGLGGWEPVAYDLAGAEWASDKPLHLRVSARANGETWATVLAGSGEDAPRLATLTPQWFHWGPRDRLTPSAVRQVATKQLPGQLAWLRKWLVPLRSDCRYELPLRVAERAAEHVIRVGEMLCTGDPMAPYLKPYGLGRRFSAWTEGNSTRIAWSDPATTGCRVETVEQDGKERQKWWFFVPKNALEFSYESRLLS